LPVTSAVPYCTVAIMGIDLSLECRKMLSRQLGVISRRQALACRVPLDTITNQLRSGRWQRLQTGVYATFTGTPSHGAQLWAVVLRAGPGAALSYETAAELHGISGRVEPVIHVTVSGTRHPVPIRGAVVHRAGRLDRTRHPVQLPPRTRIEDTALDLTQVAPSFDDAFGWLCRAVGQRLTSAARLQEALDARPKVRWRASMTAALGDIGSGVASSLEYRYARDVERRHGLPPAQRQAKVELGTRIRYLDNLYAEARLAVELDGQVAHPIERRWADVHRDNAHATVGLITLRYSWADVTARPCLVAGQVAAVLQQRGATVRLRSCGPRCTAGEAGPA
jgi:hypothetical protein